jgi:hypothetical protein
MCGLKVGKNKKQWARKKFEATENKFGHDRLLMVLNTKIFIFQRF